MGFRTVLSGHTIIPIMLGEADLATPMPNRLLRERVYDIGFSYPVAPKDQVRIPVRISVTHTRDQLAQAL